MRFGTGYIVLAGLAGWAAPAAAQDAAPSPTVLSLPAPPSGFDAVQATDEERARYGLPRRPSPFARNPMAYRTWLQAMTAARSYVAPEIVATRRRHMRALSVRTTTTAGAFYSQNWSGQAVLGNATSYGPASYSEALAQWVVSSVQSPPGICDAQDLSAVWVGIDGIAGSNDVLQGGTEADSSCLGGVNRQTFYPWFEWYPDYEYEITNFPVAAGSPMLVVVQASSATTGTVTYVNVASHAYTVAGVTAPPGTSLHGNSAEWIVERPATGAGNTLATLADYGFVLMTSEVAFLSSQLGTNSYDVPGAPGGGRVGYTITMLDANNNQLAYSRPQGTSAQELDPAGATIR